MIISPYVIDNKKPRHQHIEQQGDRYLPPLQVPQRATILGKKGQPVIRTAFFKNPEVTPTFVTYPHIGLSIDNPIIAKAVYRPRQRRNTAPCSLVCGNLAGLVACGTHLNLEDMTDPDPRYGNVHLSFYYDFWNKHGMAKMEDGITVQVSTHAPYYVGKGGNEGGGVELILKFEEVGKKANVLNLVVRLYALNKNQGYNKERPISIEPNNLGLHVSGYVGRKNKYVTALPGSALSGRSRGDSMDVSPFEDTFRFTIAPDNFNYLLTDAEVFLDRPLGPISKWRFGATSMNYELNGKGQAQFAGAHAGLCVE